MQSTQPQVQVCFEGQQSYKPLWKWPEKSSKYCKTISIDTLITDSNKVLNAFFEMVKFGQNLWTNRNPERHLGFIVFYIGGLNQNDQADAGVTGRQNKSIPLDKWPTGFQAKF